MFLLSIGVGVCGDEKNVEKAFLHIPVIFHLSFFCILGGILPMKMNSLGSCAIGSFSNILSILCHTKSFQGDGVGSSNLCNHLVANAFICLSSSKNLQPPWLGCCDIRHNCVWVLVLVSVVWPLLVDHMNVFTKFLSCLLNFSGTSID